MIPKRFIPLLFLLFCGDAGFALGEEKALSESTYRELEDSDDLIEQGSFQRALTDLNRLMPKLGARTYDRAVALQVAGHIHTAMGNRPAAIRAFTPNSAARSTAWRQASHPAG